MNVDVEKLGSIRVGPRREPGVLSGRPSIEPAVEMELVKTLARRFPGRFANLEG